MPRTRCGLNGCSTHIDRLTNFSSGATTLISSRSPVSARSASSVSNPATPPPTMITRSRMTSSIRLGIASFAFGPALQQQEDAVQHRVGEGKMDRHRRDEDPVLADRLDEHHDRDHDRGREEEAEHQPEPGIPVRLRLLELGTHGVLLSFSQWSCVNEYGGRAGPRYGVKRAFLQAVLAPPGSDGRLYGVPWARCNAAASSFSRSWGSASSISGKSSRSSSRTWSASRT